MNGFVNYIVKECFGGIGLVKVGSSIIYYYYIVKTIGIVKK